MKRFRWFPLVVMLLAMQPVVFSAQTIERPKPWFTLHIEEADPHHLHVGYPAPPNFHELRVTFTNISDQAHSDYADGIDAEQMLNMIVLRDGAAADETKNMQNVRDAREARRVGHTKSGGPLNFSIHGPIKPLKPGESVTVPLYISAYFDMSKPGTYSITVTRETFPWEPARSVTVWSNTLTIVVSSDKPSSDDEE